VVTFCSPESREATIGNSPGRKSGEHGIHQSEKVAKRRQAENRFATFAPRENACRRFATSMMSITAPAWLPTHAFASEPPAPIDKHRFGNFFQKDGRPD